VGADPGPGPVAAGWTQAGVIPAHGSADIPIEAMKTAIKLLLAAIVIHGAVRLGSAYWTCFQYEDALQQIAQFAGNRPAKEVHGQAVKKAAELGVPVDAEAIQVRRDDREVVIDVHYTSDVQLFPSYYYPWEFTASVKAWTRAY